MDKMNQPMSNEIPPTTTKCFPFIMRQEKGDGSKKTELIVRSSLRNMLNIQSNTTEEEIFRGFAISVTTLRGKNNFFDSTRKRQYQHCQIGTEVQSLLKISDSN